MSSLLYTGASGFLGVNTLPLLMKKYSIKTIGLTDKDDFELNLALEVPTLNERFEIVLHAAGKAHSIPKTDLEKQSFFDVNMQGTKNLCTALEKYGLPKSFIFISTVAVYGLEYGEDISEDSPLNGVTPYALSKIQAEQYLIEWCTRNKVVLSIIRPSLIAGPNPPGNLGAMIKGIKSGKYLSIAGGKARKSVLMVHDIANLVPKLNEKGGIYNVCDCEHPSFGELELSISKQLRKVNPISIPLWLAKVLALAGDIFGSKAPLNSEKLDKITKSLTFSNTKAITQLGWKPINVLENFKI
jgi:nucleoside-diphosphate-sugar epimerase